MAEHFLIPKRLSRALPWLSRAAWQVEAVFIRLMIWLLRLCSIEPATRIAMAALRGIGPLMPMWDKVARNLRVAFPAMSEQDIAHNRRQIFGYLGAAIAELVLSDRLWQQRAERFEFIADGNIQGIASGGRPMVLVTAHVGAWQLSNLIAARYQFPLTSLYAPESNPRLGAITLKLRSALPCTWISRDGGVRRLMQELRDGRSVGLACDTRLDQGDAVPFFGHPAMTNTVPARLALKQDCELIPVRVERLPGVRFRITMETPISPRNPKASEAEQALDMTTQLNARFEEWISQTPEQWMCLARRFPKEIDKAARG